MKTRIISAFVGLVLLSGVFAGFYLPFLVEAVCAFLAVIAVYELLCETGLAKRPCLYVPTMLLTAWIPFSFRFESPLFTFCPAVVLLTYFLLLLLRRHDLIRFEQICICFFAALVLPLGFSSMLVFRDHGTPHGIFYTLVALGGAWFSDIGGYFIGRKFGKHPLAPTISPKKSKEGVVGGFFTILAGMALLGFLYVLIYNSFFANGISLTVHYGWLLLVGIILMPIGICGDLVASVIKRQTKIKDFGKIMPGHGGVLDRFDSALWTMSALALFLLLGGKLLMFS